MSIVRTIESGKTSTRVPIYCMQPRSMYRFKYRGNFKNRRKQNLIGSYRRILAENPRLRVAIRVGECRDRCTRKSMWRSWLETLDILKVLQDHL